MEGLISARREPKVSANQSMLWMASEGGVKDGVSYGAGDVLITINVSGVSKTKILADYSAL
jgi:ethanolamine ammonia-lyase large subunit